MCLIHNHSLDLNLLLVIMFSINCWQQRFYSVFNIYRCILIILVNVFSRLKFFVITIVLVNFLLILIMNMKFERISNISFLPFLLVEIVESM